MLYYSTKNEIQEDPRREKTLSMSSLQELCLNTIENNGTSVREVLKEAPVPKKYTHRHPYIEISFDYVFFGTDTSGNSLVPEFIYDQLDVSLVFTLEYDGVYHLKWSMKISDDYHDRDDITEFQRKLGYDDYKVENHLDRADVLKYGKVLLKKHYPWFPRENGEMKFDNDVDIRRETADPLGRFEPNVWYENKIVNKLLEMNKEAQYVFADLKASNGDLLFSFLNKSLEKENYLENLNDVVNSLKRLSMCY